MIALSPSQPDRPFHGLWSLWEMAVNFRLNAVRLIHIGLNTLIGISNKNQRAVEDAGGYRNPDVISSPALARGFAEAVIEVQSVISLAETTFADLRCIHINHAIDTLKWWVQYDKKEWSDLKARAVSLRDAIDNELKEHLYYQYPKPKGAKLLSWQTDWRHSIVAFPSISHEVFSTTDCYALGHDTASVFHCMRILEYGLGALAGDVGLTFDLQQWHNIIEEIEAKITELRKTLPRSTGRNERLQFLSEAAKEFFYFKDGW
jgi:hypothetical protein